MSDQSTPTVDTSSPLPGNHGRQRRRRLWPEERPGLPRRRPHPPAPRHVHRQHRHRRAAPPRLRNGLQQRRRGAGRLLQEHPGDDQHGRQPAASTTTAAASPSRNIPTEKVHARSRADHGRRRRPSSKEHLQGLGRAARHGRQGGDRPERMGRGRGPPQRPGLRPGVRARQGRPPRVKDIGAAEAHRHQDHLQARPGDLPRARRSTTTRWKTASASWRS